MRNSPAFVVKHWLVELSSPKRKFCYCTVGLLQEREGIIWRASWFYSFLGLVRDSKHALNSENMLCGMDDCLLEHY
jgi:hypothetical protein